MLRERLDDMPMDKAFYNDDGNRELCHATGYEVFITADGQWWNEYEDSAGNIYYGR